MSDLRQYPFIHVDPGPIAKGIVEMFTPSQLAALRFGLLPAEVIEMLEKQMLECLKGKLHYQDNGDGTWNVYFTPGNDVPCGVRIVVDGKLAVCENVNVKKLVGDVVHTITLRMYDQVEMVV